MQTVEMLGLFRAPHVAIALRERIDGRVDHESRNGQRGGGARVGEDDGVVALGDGTEDVPELRLGGREIMMAAPEPPRLAPATLHKEERGGIVDHDEIGIEPEPAGVLRAYVAKP